MILIVTLILVLVFYRTEWQEMKRMFCDLQKEHMRQLKSEMGSCSINKGGSTTKKKKTGFVANCLLKVTCLSEGGMNVADLKVRVAKN